MQFHKQILPLAHKISRTNMTAIADRRSSCCLRTCCPLWPGCPYFVVRATRVPDTEVGGVHAPAAWTAAVLCRFSWPFHSGLKAAEDCRTPSPVGGFSDSYESGVTTTR